MKWAKTNRGFTIVELLIVIVVIAILAAITIVSYNGVTKLATVASVRSDIANLGKQIEIFEVKHGNYPYVLGPKEELEEVVKGANLWDATRVSDLTNNDEIESVERSFIFCTSQLTGELVVAASSPILKGVSSSNLTPAVGKPLYYYSTRTGQGEVPFQYDGVTNNTGYNICRTILPDFSATDVVNYRRMWTFSLGS